MKLVYGVGINDLPKGACSITVNSRQYLHPFYHKWRSMLARCYSQVVQDAHQTYVGCEVCESWKTLSHFKEWFDSQPQNRYTWQLDKDVLVCGNKVYSPETCLLIPQWLNKFLTNTHDGGCCYYHKRNKKYTTSVNDFHTGKRKHLGYFDTEDEAKLEWKKAKLELITSNQATLDDIDKRLFPALVKRYG